MKSCKDYALWYQSRYPKTRVGLVHQLQKKEYELWPQGMDRVYHVHADTSVTNYLWTEDMGPNVLHHGSKKLGLYKTREYAEWVSKNRQALHKLQIIAICGLKIMVDLTLIFYAEDFCLQN